MLVCVLGLSVVSYKVLFSPPVLWILYPIFKCCDFPHVVEGKLELLWLFSWGRRGGSQHGQEHVDSRCQLRLLLLNVFQQK